jgi:hypothetical protein
MSASQDREPESSFRFLLDRLARARGPGFGLFGADSSKLFRVGENEIHVLVEGEHLTRHLPPIVQGHAHPPVDLSCESVSFPSRCVSGS